MYKTFKIKSEPNSSKMEGKKDQQKIRVHLKDACFFCGRNMSSAKQTINHNIRIHGYKLPTRKQGSKRPESKLFEFVREKNGNWDSEELACPSCWFHCPENDLDVLYQHTLQEHEIVKVEGAKSSDTQGGYEYAASASVRARRTRRLTSEDEEGKGKSTGRRTKQTGDIETGSTLSSDAYNASTKIYRKLEELTDLFRSFVKV
jgi:Pyruvate/2-oxoacid:ferredoxin oxidoreductase delta subunit